jgi:hypothetical protein
MNMMPCPICGSSAEFKAYAIVAPWISKLLAENSLYSELFSCEKCTLGFYSYRYSEVEAEKLYSSYRTGRYFEVRHSWEPWYGSNENNLYVPEVNQRNIDSRLNYLEKNLKLAGVKTFFVGCVDFGGDLGQFFPKNVSGAKYLIDHSSTSLENREFTRINGLNDIRNTVELVMNCHVLEHMSILTEVLQEMANALTQTGVIYLEVPLDAFETSGFHKKKIYKNYLQIISKNKILFLILDLITGVTRQFFRKIPWFGIVKQSEHINYFNSRALTALCLNFEGKIWISEEDYSHKVGKFQLGRISAVLSRS